MDLDETFLSQTVIPQDGEFMILCVNAGTDQEYLTH